MKAPKDTQQELSITSTINYSTMHQGTVCYYDIILDHIRSKTQEMNYHIMSMV